MGEKIILIDLTARILKNDEYESSWRRSTQLQTEYTKIIPCLDIPHIKTAKHQDKILKTARENRHITHKGTIRLNSTSQQTPQMPESNRTFQVSSMLRKSNCHLQWSISSDINI